MRLPSFFRKRTRAAAPSPTSPTSPADSASSAVQPGQASVPTVSLFGSSSLLAKVQGAIPKRQAIYDVDVNELRKYPVETLISNLDSISPEGSMALWIMRRLCGFPRLAGVIDENGLPNQDGYDYLVSVEPRIARYFGGLPGLANQIHAALYTQGGIGLEDVFAENKRDLLDIVSVDPASLTWFQERAADGQIIYIPKQFQSTGMIELTKPGFFYAPLDPKIGDPQGTSPILSYFQVAFADLQTYYDLEKIIHNQGFPRFHAKLVGELIRKNAPPSIANDEKKLAAYTRSQLTLVNNIYKSLEPDDAWVTLDNVEIKVIDPGTSSAVSATTLQNVFKTKIANSLKMLTTFLNYAAGTTETFGTVQWKIMVDTVESIRAVAKKILEDALTFALNVQGYSGWAVVEYEAIPRETALVDEQVKMSKLRYWTFARDSGFVTHDTAAQKIFDMDKAEAEAVPMFGAGAGLGALVAEGEEETTPSPEKSARMPIERGHTTVHPGGRKSLSISKAVTMEKSYRQQAAGKYRRQSDGIRRLLRERLKLSDS